MGRAGRDGLVACAFDMARKSKVRDDHRLLRPIPPMSWREQVRKCWEQRERHLLLDRKAAWEQEDAQFERAEQLAAENRQLRTENERLQARVRELESLHRPLPGG